MNRLIYLDASATTPVSPRVKEKMLSSLDLFGNPSSVHTAGAEAAKAIETARGQVLKAAGAKKRGESRLIFTSCGTEANNTVLFGAAHAKKRNAGGKIVITDSEHPSILRAADRLAEEGFRIEKLSTAGGKIDRDELIEKVKDAFLLSIMAVNNETGADYGVSELFAIAKGVNPSLITHTDAVQGFLKIPLSFDDESIDLMSVSGHKIHAPKGIGGLLVKQKRIRSGDLLPFLVGGGQEEGFRSGTENLPGILAFGEAAEEGSERFSEAVGRVSAIKDRILHALPEEIRPNLPEKASPFLLNFTLPGIKSETMLRFLSAKGICVSAGSACSAKAGHVSNTLLAFGLTEREADSSLRVSFSRENTPEDADALLSALGEGLGRLARVR